MEPNQRPSEGPSEDAYERVTDPERYRLLHEVASTLLDNLVAKYDVERRVILDELPSGDDETVVRLVPAGGGATLTVTFTSFPGLRVGFGDWHSEGFPTCGCDACDEHPQSVADDFAWKVGALVAGEFSEHLRRLPRPSLTYEFEPGNPGWNRLTHADVRRRGRPGLRQWQPWSRR